MKDLICRLLLWGFSRISLKNNILLESDPDVSDNTYIFFQYLIEKGCNKKYKIIWILNSYYKDYKDYPNVKYVSRYSKNPFHKIYIKYLLSVSKYIFDSNSYIYPQREEQIRIYLGHGMPIKIVPRYCQRIGRINGIITTSDYFTKLYSELFNINQDQILPLGYPRNDVLINKDTSALKKKLFSDRKIIVWMPTYRQHKNGAEDTKIDEVFKIGIPAIHSNCDLNMMLKNLIDYNILILFRPHPAQDLSNLKLDSSENFILADNNYLRRINISLYELLAISDALITDYSSVYYDYLLTNRPIGLTIEDKKLFFETFMCAFNDYEKYIVGHYIYKIEDLIAFIKFIIQGKDETIKELNSKKAEYHLYVDGQSSARIYNYLVEHYNF